MKRLLAVMLTLVVLGVLVIPAHAADPITVTSNTFTCNFRQNLKFDLQAQSAAGKIRQIALYIKIESQSSTARQLPEFTPDKQVQTEYVWSLTQNYLPPGVTGQFWWTIEDDAGNKITTDKQPFRVEDSTKKWDKLANEQFALYWYDGSAAFGRKLYERGIETIKYMERDVGIIVDTQIQTFIYANKDEFRNAIPVSSQDWTGGLAFTYYGVILMNVSPDEQEWGLQVTTHELAHHIIRHKIEGPLGDLSMPNWVSEGLAKYYEYYPGALSPSYANLLNRAIQGDTLPPLRTLSGTFPTDSSAAYLAYAQSYSVVDFIYRKHGKEKMARLLQEIKKGGGYDDIVTRVFGFGVDTLDNEWRNDVGLKPRALPTQSSRLPTPIPTLSLSIDDLTLFKPTPTFTPVAATPTKTPSPLPTLVPTLSPSTGDATPSLEATAAPTPMRASEPTAAPPTAVPVAAVIPPAETSATPARVVQNLTSVPTLPANTSGGSGNPSGQLCGGTFGMIVLGLFGAVWSARSQRGHSHKD